MIVFCCGKIDVVMEMQRYFSNKLKDNKFELRNDDIYHITRVMRMKSGDNIEIVCDENVYLCCIDFVNGNLEVNVVKCYEKSDEKIIEKVLIIPLLKETKVHSGNLDAPATALS